MRQDIELVNRFSGIRETYASPPWRLEGVSAHARGSLVRLVHVNGEQTAIPVFLQADHVLPMFADWPTD